jgi:hypothetical protein
MTLPKEIAEKLNGSESNISGFMKLKGKLWLGRLNMLI